MLQDVHDAFTMQFTDSLNRSPAMCGSIVPRWKITEVVTNAEIEQFHE